MKQLNLMTTPDVDIKVFRGNPIDFDYFVSIFKEVVENRVEDSMGRLTRLLKYTDGEPKDLIKHCISQPRSEGYQMQ